MGRVNALGKFEADTDLQLFKTESSIAKTVKRFVNFDEKEKAKEELAWQVAAMIVNEVTSVTMGGTIYEDSPPVNVAFSPVVSPTGNPQILDRNKGPVYSLKWFCNSYLPTKTMMWSVFEISKEWNKWREIKRLISKLHENQIVVAQ